MKTLFVKPAEAERSWFIIDAQGKRLGRIAVKVAHLLRGKHKPYYTPHQEIGDYVIIINADKVDISGRKRENKVYYHHTGYVGGLKEVTFAKMIERKPVQPLELAIRGMLPKGPLGRQLFTNVKVYAGPNHPHAAQQPVAIEL
ncbi:MAG: 50S ribosomal protein L13 [Spirochaetes bacterium]|nr:50S ribosomal protein L13 [Spirochaetota bacterium]MBU0953923.1 50S ribosomal protein L13 [Spirochaetota bacterium]